MRVVKVRPVRLGGEGSSSGRRGVRPSIQPTSQREGQRRRKKYSLNFVKDPK
jgi:hypothetical protein